MDFEKIEAFVRLHWPAGVIVSIIAVPVIWTVSAMYYSERLAIMEAKVKALEERAAVLEKVLTSNQKTRIEGGGAEFKAADLYVPSTPIKLP